MHGKRLLSIAALALAGCAISPEKYSDEGACVAYGDAVRAGQAERENELLRDLQRRGYKVSPSDREKIAKKSVSIGMSTCSMFASWGHSTRDNRTSTGSGVRIQHVYRTEGFYGRYIRIPSTASYVYTENGVVTAIQN